MRPTMNQTPNSLSPSVVLDFWFGELTEDQWFKSDQKIDAWIRERFQSILEQAIRNELHYWRSTARGRLAEILVLDQFSRTCYRGSASAFAQDPQALALA